MSKADFKITTKSEDETAAFASRLAPMLRTGDVLLLDGSIGAGKTAFARALIRARLNATVDVPSPTFTIVQTYEGPDCDIWHCDLYRLTHPDEADELGLTEAFETALCLVEWPDRLAGGSPASGLPIHFTAHDTSHEITLNPNPAWQIRLGHLFD